MGPLEIMDYVVYILLVKRPTGYYVVIPNTWWKTGLLPTIMVGKKYPSKGPDLGFLDKDYPVAESNRGGAGWKER